MTRKASRSSTPPRAASTELSAASSWLVKVLFGGSLDQQQQVDLAAHPFDEQLVDVQPGLALAGQVHQPQPAHRQLAERAEDLHAAHRVVGPGRVVLVVRVGDVRLELRLGQRQWAGRGE
jgi:hypothetical protein